MCWSGEASTVLAAVGISTTVFAAYKKEPTAIWMTLGYFSLMEALQAFTYTVIDDCQNPANQIATLLGYLHIAFQPFFISAISLYFIPDHVSRKIYFYVYALCFASTIYMFIQLYPLSWAGECSVDRSLCGAQLCSVSGNWHIAWDIPLNGIGNSTAAVTSFVSYSFVAFLLPVLYGSWRFTIYHLLMGPGFAFLLTDNANEWPAVWCLLSIGFLLIVVKTRIRDILHVKTWWLWPDLEQELPKPLVAEES